MLGRIKEQNKQRKIYPKKKKLRKLGKIHEIYASKWKSNIIGQKIRRKTHYLTQNCTQNDLINHQSGFKVQVENSSYPLNEILISLTP